MSIVLGIYSCFPSGGVSLTRNKQLAAAPRIINAQTDYQTSIHSHIKKLCQEATIHLKEIHAVCVCVGPGSYTGTRIGLATAKGICWALQKPLITVSSLEVMAHAANKIEAVTEQFICIVHARQDTVYTASYNKKNVCYIAPVILSVKSLEKQPSSLCIVGRQEEEATLQKILSSKHLSIEIKLQDFFERGHDVFDLSLDNNIQPADITFVEPLYANTR